MKTIALEDEIKMEYEGLVTYAGLNGILSALKIAADEIVNLRREIEGYRIFKQSVDEALNRGDGSYRP